MLIIKDLTVMVENKIVLNKFFKWKEKHKREKEKIIFLIWTKKTNPTQLMLSWRECGGKLLGGRKGKLLQGLTQFIFLKKCFQASQQVPHSLQPTPLALPVPRLMEGFLLGEPAILPARGQRNLLILGMREARELGISRELTLWTWV